MTIGVDLRVLQIGHQYRGIGEVTKQVLNEVFQLAIKDEKQPRFIFYRYDDETDPKSFLEIPDGLVFEEIVVGKRPMPGDGRSVGQKALAKWRVWCGNPLPRSHLCDVLLQFDYSLGVPKGTRTLLIKHDIIPYVFWNDYFTPAMVHFRHRAARTTIRTVIHNFEYKHILMRSVRNAWKIACVSEHTRKDLVEYLHVSPKKMFVTHLAASAKPLKASEATATERGRDGFPTKPFLLFVGAGDARRRVEDIISAFNNLKADGADIQLALVGENFQSPEKIPNESVRRAVMESSYRDDILTLGYIDDVTKQALYKEAIAFVFATAYEGFGIPVLESMSLKCPVIAYENSSIPEVGGTHIFYARDWEGILAQTKKIMSMTASEREQWLDAAADHASTFSYHKTGIEIYKTLKSASKN